MFGGEEQQIDFANQIPVHITYQTAFVDEHGKLQFRDDVYGLDAKLLSILRGQRAGGGRRRDRAAGRSQLQADAGAAAQRLSSAARGGGSPFALFEQLFR